MKRWGFCITILAVLAALVILTRPLNAGELKVGVVDLQRALNQSDRGKRAKEELKREFQKKTQEIEAKRAEAEGLREELEKKGSLLSPATKKKKEEEYRSKLRELKHLIDDSKAELATKENELSSQILKDLVRMLQEKAKREGYSLILEMNGGIIYCDPALNLTKDIIKRYDISHPSLKKGKATRIKKK